MTTYKRIITILTVVLLYTTVVYSKNHAILIGIQNYDNYAPLESCYGDVEDMKAMLMQSGFEPDYIWEIKDEYGKMITASKLDDNIQAFSRGISKGDKVIFYFSGHGVGDRNGDNYLLGYDGSMSRPEKYGISVSYIKTQLKQKHPAEVVLIIDACRSFINKKGRSAGQKIKPKLNTGKGVRIQEISFGVKIQKLPSLQPRTPQVKNTIVKTIYAASEGQQSFERKDKNNGAFTYYLTYLVDAPNSAMDVDMSKDGIISIEDIVKFADNRLKDYCKRRNLPKMEPVYQTDGGVDYTPFLLFRYNAEKEVKTRKQKQIKPVFQYDEQAELAKIKSFQEDLSYLNEELPVYKPQNFSKDEINIDELETSNLESWQLALVTQEKIESKKSEEIRKKRLAEAKQKEFEKLKKIYNQTIQKVERIDDLFEKYRLLEKIRYKINNSIYPSIKQKILVLLEPVYQKIKKAKENKEVEIDKLENKFEKDLVSMEKMKVSKLKLEIKKKYLESFKTKWQDYVKLIQNQSLKERWKWLFYIPKNGNIRKININGCELEMVYVKGGIFMRGSNNGESDEKPVRKVRLKNFYIGKFEVTQAQWKVVMGNNPSRFKENNLPVEKVSWEDCQKFLKKLNQKTGNVFRLPTEAEWEYASKGGNKSKGYKYSGSNRIAEVAWYGGNSRKKTHPVGQKKPNELDIYDMSGNVWEWCQDWYGNNYYRTNSVDNPTGPNSGINRVFRGASCYDYGGYCRSSNRNSNSPSIQGSSLGLRLLLPAGR
jgi:formylglycine-generating enzyme required for sulfatase activity